MKTVFVPLDGSERAEAALGAAVPLATRLGAELVLLSARAPDVGIETTRNYLDVRAGSLDRPARTLLVLDRGPAAAIALAANERDAVVCMATRGRGAVRQAVLGSVAEDVVRASVTPLVLVGPRFESTWELGETPMVLAGLDGSDPSRAAALAAGRLALEIRARVRVVEVLRPSDVITVGELAINIVPTSTGAARATAIVLEAMQHRLDGTALRVPVPDGSIVDFVAVLGRDVTVEEVNDAFRAAASAGRLAAVLDYSEEPIVSSDIVGSRASCTFDAPLTMTLGNLVKVFGWYDNEFGYACRLVDLLGVVGGDSQ